MQNSERRVCTMRHMELRQHDDAPPEIVGYAAVFNERSVELWGFFEEIEPGAFTDTLSNDPDVRATIDHAGGVTTIGRTRNQTLFLEEDEVGLRVRILPPDTQAGRDVVELVRRGDVDQMSFMFRVPPNGATWYYDNDNTLIRRLRQIDLENGDVSIVTYPAYPQTSAEVRATAEKQRQLAHEPNSGGAQRRQARTKARKRQLFLLREVQR